MDDTLIPHGVGTASIRQGDALDLPLADESVDLVVTSPPYFALRSYIDGGEHYDGQIGSEETPQEFLEALWAVTRECRRVLKPSGSMWVNLGDKYAGDGRGTRPQGATGQRVDRKQAQNYVAASDRRTTPGTPAKSLMGIPWRYAIGCIDDLGLILRAEVVWSKPNGLPESVTDRVRRSHEQWFHFTKEPRYYAAVDEVREPHADTSIARSGRNRFAEDRSQEGVGSPNTVNPAQACNPLGKLPGSVWSIPSEPLRVPDHIGVDHFAAFPQEWPRRIILGWCPEGGVVLDPFGGTGTVAMVARALGRYGVHVDMSGDYNRLARWRVWQSGHEYKTHAREWAQRNGSWDKNNKPKVPAKVRRQIEAEMADRAREGRRMERDHWTTVKKKVDHG